MKIFITGATGFIGVHLCHTLVAQGHELIVLVRNPQKAQALPQHHVTFLQGDLTLFKDTNVVLPECDVVIHLAGTIFAKSRAEYHEVNCTAVEDLVGCLRRQNWQLKRFIFCSSVAAAGPTPPYTFKTEADTLMPNEPYGVSKQKAEEYLATVTDFPITIFRPGAVYGSGDLAFLTIFSMAKKGVGFCVSGHNSQFSFIYVDDLVEAIVKFINDPTQQNRTYFVNHNDVGDVHELWALLRKIVNPRLKVIPLPRLLLFVLMQILTFLALVFRFQNKLDKKEYTHMTTPAYLASSQKLQNDFDWRAQNNLEACLQKTYKGYCEAGWL